MAKIFEVDFRTGSYADRSNSISVVPFASGKITKGEKGLQYTLSGGLGNGFKIYPVLNGTYTVELAFKFKSGFTFFNNYLFDGRNAGGTSFLYGANNTILGSNSGTIYINGVATTTVKYGEYQHIIVSGISMITSNINLFCYNGGGSTNNPTGDALFFRIYSGTFTESERAKAYADFLNSYPMLPEKYPQQALVNKPMDLSREKDGWISDTVLVNGEFTTNRTGWGGDSGVTTSFITPGVVRLTSAVGGYGGIGQSVLIPGTKYRCTYRYRTDGTAVAGISNTVSGSVYKNLIRTVNFIEGSFEFTAATNAMLYITKTSSSGLWVEFDYIRIQAITGLVAAYNMIPNGNTLVDISGNGRNGTIYGAMSTKEGLSFNGILNKVTLPDLSSYINLTSIFSISIRFNLKYNTPSTQTLFNCTKSGSDLFGIGIDTSLMIVKAGLYNGSSYIHKAHGSIALNTPTTVTVVYTTTTLIMYINGILVTGNTYSPSLATAVNTFIGINTSNIYPFHGDINDLRTYNRILSESEIKAYHNSFVKPYLIEDFSSEGADGIAKVPTGWSKTSGSFKIGEWQPISLSNIFNSATINFDGGNWTAYTGWQIADGVASRPIYDGSAGSLYLINAIGNPLNIGRLYRCRYKLRKINTFAGKIQVLNSSRVVYNCLNTLNEQLFTFYSYDRNFRFYGDGSWNGEIDWCVIEEIPPLPTFKPGTKYLECITAGVLAIPSKQAYGTWEFDLYKGADANSYRIGLIESKTVFTTASNGYFLNFPNTEFIGITQMDGTPLMYSNNNYLSNNTWYRIKITRTLSGIFTVLIKGGSFTPTTGYDGWTLVSTTGGSGTNPVTDNTYTTSEYFVLDIDAGDRIANIKLTDGIKQ